MSYYFAICDEQEGYVHKLTEYLNASKLVPFQILSFSSVDKLKEYQKRTPIELLLISERLFEENEDKNLAASIILLNESKMVSKSVYRSVYKYQSAKQLAKAVLEIYGEIGDPTRLEIANKKVTIIGVYSPVKRCLQTSFCLTLGQMLAKKKRCLYLNFEPFSGLSGLMDRQFEQDFMDLLYFFNGGIEKFIYKLKGMVETIGDLDFIPPALSFMDLLQMEGENFRMLLHEIAVRTDYEIVILDLSESVQSLFDILLSCDRVYSITRTDGVSEAKFAQYEQLLQFMKKEEILNHTRKITFPQIKELPSRFEELAYGQFADCVKEILKDEEEIYVQI